jgi:hypothetical protein
MTSLTSSLNPSVYPEAVTFTATVQDLSSNPITCGTVTFNDGATPIASGVPLGSPTSDQAQFTTSSLAVGNHSITAAYVPGACLFITSTSNIVTQAVTAPLKVTPFGIVFTASTFGNTGTTTPARLITITNTTAATTFNIGTISTATTSGPGSPPNFQLSSDPCSNTALAPGATCTEGVTFTATGVGDYTGTVSIPSDAPNSPQIVTLSGSGIEGLLGVSPTMVFPNTSVGFVSASRTATLTNPNSVALTIDSVTPSGDFGIVADGCSGVLPANTSCMVTVSFSPTAQGTRTGSLTVVSNTRNSPVAIAMQGNGTLSTLAIVPTSVSFGTVAHGTTSPDKLITVTNNNPATPGGTITFSSIATTSSVFAVDGVGTTCGSTLAGGGASCTIAVNFSPTGVGATSATLNIIDNAGTGSPLTTQKVSLSGTGN